MVPEMNRGQVLGLVKQYVNCDAVGLWQTNGEVISPKSIVDKVMEDLP